MTDSLKTDRQRIDKQLDKRRDDNKTIAKNKIAY